MPPVRLPLEELGRRMQLRHHVRSGWWIQLGAITFLGRFLNRRPLQELQDSYTGRSQHFRHNSVASFGVRLASFAHTDIVCH